MKETLTKSAPAYSTLQLQSGMLNLKLRAIVMPCTYVDDQQLPSMKKLFKKSTNLS